jgi:hypothetical protein
MEAKPKWPWGGDRTWTNGAWRDTEATAVRAGAGALLAEPIKEPAGKKFWGLLGVVIALPFALWTLTAIISRPREAGLQLVVLLAILGFSLRSVAKAHTRRIQFDEAGLSDADFFGVRRVPWGEIKGLHLVNLNADAQARYSRTRMKDREGSRPTNDWGAWDVCGEQGVVLLRMYKNMVPWDALTALRQRIELQVRGGGGDAIRFGKQPAAPRGPAAPGDSNDPRDRKQIEEHEEIARRMNQVRAQFGKRGDFVERVMKGFMALVFLVPLAGTGYFGYQSLWFRFAAAEAQGRVVSIHPTLVVEYPVSAERTVRWGDSHAGDSGLAVDARVRVFYDPADPERMRLDLFDEMWLGTLLLGGLTLFVGLLAGAVWGTMRQARSKLPRG